MDHLNVTFIGHVDSGKSTLCGQLLCQYNVIDSRTIEKYKALAIENHRESWYLAYIMDVTEEERERGKTVDCGITTFSSGLRKYTLLDAPGHKLYVPNMISGIAQADVACLLISSRSNEFEAGFVKNGQTKEHAIIAKVIGITKIIVLVNKMDDESVRWNKSRYDEIVEKVTRFLNSIGYNQNSIKYIPISGYSCINIVGSANTDVCDWYTGTTLMEELDNTPPVQRNPNSKLLAPISDSYRDNGALTIRCKIESGTLTPGSQLYLTPQQEVITDYIVNCDTETIPGANMSLTIKGINLEYNLQGSVLADEPINSTTDIVAKIYIMELLEGKNVFCAGYRAILHIHEAVVEFDVVKLLELLDPRTSVCIKKLPVSAITKNVVHAHLRLFSPVVLEKFTDCPQLGRFILRDQGRTIGFGNVVSCVAPKYKKN